MVNLYASPFSLSVCLSYTTESDIQYPNTRSLLCSCKQIMRQTVILKYASSAQPTTTVTHFQMWL